MYSFLSSAYFVFHLPFSSNFLREKQRFYSTLGIWCYTFSPKYWFISMQQILLLYTFLIWLKILPNFPLDFSFDLWCVHFLWLHNKSAQIGWLKQKKFMFSQYRCLQLGVRRTAIPLKALGNILLLASSSGSRCSLA